MKNSWQHPAPGKMLTVNGHSMHVFAAGPPAETFVFLAGSGTACPTLDFKPLWSLLAKNCQIAVVEKAGYGWSETTNTPRDIDTMLAESREALRLAGLQPPYILVPHSMSGLEALYWAQQHPSEVKAIIGLDAAVPEVYESFGLPSGMALRVLGLLTSIGIHKLLARSVYKKSPAAQSGVLSWEEGETYIEMIKNRTFTSDMINEAKHLRQNTNKVKNGTVPADMPMLFFISRENDAQIANWSEILLRYAAGFKNGKTAMLDCGHYVHAYEPEKIAAAIKEFLA